MAQAPQSFNTYADQRNSQYSNSSSLYLDLKDRFNQAMMSLPQQTQVWIRSQLNHAIKIWKNNNPNIKKFDQLPLCTARTSRLSRLLIDGSMQRMLDIMWVIRILTEFRPTQAMAIQVYEVDHKTIDCKYHYPDTLYAAWEGQHTAIAFWIIATMILGEDPDEVTVPVVIYSVKSKAEIRDNFMKNNTEEGKKLLDTIDVVQQQIYAVRIDGNQNPIYQEVELKQQYLESSGLFLTDKKFNDINQVGAISRVEDVMSNKISAEQVRQFCVYARTVLDHTPRAINTKEAPIILGFLKMAALGSVTYTDDDIRSLANLCIMLFGADFDAKGVFWSMAERAYLNSWNQIYGGNNWAGAPSRPRFNKDWTNGGTYFWYQLKKSWLDKDGNHMPIPALNIQSSFIPALKDLF